MPASGKDIACPLCRSGDWTLVDRISPDDLDRLYDQRFGIRVADHFQGIGEIGLYECGRCFLRYFHPAIAGSAQFYRSLNRFEWYYLGEKAEYRTAASLIPAGSRVLDVGCGEGKFAEWIRSSDYVGLEMNLPPDRAAGSRWPTVLPESVADHSLRHPAGYDVVCTFQVLEHVVDVNDFIGGCLRCLKPGGRLIISVPAADSFVTQTVNGLLNLPPHHLSWWPDATLSYLPQEYDLTIEKIIHEPLERIHYRWYSSNWALGLVARLVGSRPRLIDNSSTHRLLSRLLLPVALVRWFSLFIDPRPIAGHSVVAVCRKGISD